MPQYEVELDGQKYVLEGNQPPTEAEARQVIQSKPSTSSPLNILRATAAAPIQAVTERMRQPISPIDPLGITSRLTQTVAKTPQMAIDVGLPIVGGFTGGPGGLPGISAGVGVGAAAAKTIEIVRKDTGEPLTVDGFSQSAKEVLGAGATAAAGTAVFGLGLKAAALPFKLLFGQRGLLGSGQAHLIRQHQLEREAIMKGLRQQRQLIITQKDNAIRMARDQSAAATQTLGAATRNRIAKLTAEQEAINLRMNEVAEQSVLKVRDAFPGVAKATSETFEILRDSALKGLEGTEVPFVKVIQALQQRLGADPEIFQLALKRLGVSEDLAALFMRFGPERIADVSRGQAITVGKLLDNIRKLKTLVKVPARASKRVYTFEEKIADDASDALIDVLRQQGVEGLEIASKFWAQWAPIRDQAFREFRPFLQTATETQQGIVRLIKVARGNDPGNKVFIEELEKRLSVPLTNELKGMAQRLGVIDKIKLASQTYKQLQSGRIGQVSRKAIQDAKDLFTQQSQQLSQAQQAALAKGGELATRQFQELQRFASRRRVAQFIYQSAKLVVVYEMLRRGFRTISGLVGDHSE
jgi:hypothetical protein